LISALPLDGDGGSDRHIRMISHGGHIEDGMRKTDGHRVMWSKRGARIGDFDNPSTGAKVRAVHHHIVVNLGINTGRAIQGELGIALMPQHRDHGSGTG
jgi:hypothetical protein